MFDYGHFPENFPGAEPGNNPLRPAAGGNFHLARFDKINAIARRALMENFLAGGKAAFLRDPVQGLQFGTVQMPEERVGFERGHPATLGENGPA